MGAQLVEPGSVAVDVDGAPTGTPQDGDGVAVAGVPEEEPGLATVDGGELRSSSGRGVARAGGLAADGSGGVAQLGTATGGGALRSCGPAGVAGVGRGAAPTAGRAVAVAGVVEFVLGVVGIAAVGVLGGVGSGVLIGGARVVGAAVGCVGEVVGGGGVFGVATAGRAAGAVGVVGVMVGRVGGVVLGSLSAPRSGWLSPSPG